MNTKEGYSKKSLTDTRILLAGGGDMALSDIVSNTLPITFVINGDSYNYNFALGSSGTQFTFIDTSDVAHTYTILTQ